MTRNLFLALSAVLVLAAACQKQEPAASTEATPPASTAAPAATPPPAQTQTAPPPAAAPAGAGSTATGTAAAAAPAAASLASQETNWPGISADVTEFKRKGNTLTAKVVLRNHAGADAEPDINYKEVYLMDLAAGKKYEVLKDEKGAYIAALRSGWNDRWYQKIEPGQSFTIWMKFPAPPADVKSVTLQLPGMPPFEDLAIQDV
jgi:hypothetical protein